MNEQLTFLGVQDFHPWPELVPDDARARMQSVVRVAYGVGLVGGLLWGGLRGLLAGWATAATIKHAMGSLVYLEQPDPGYRKVAAFTGTVAAVDLMLASWLARGVVSRREDEGRSTWGLAH